jgi:hypothetical protein
MQALTSACDFESLKEKKNMRQFCLSVCKQRGGTIFRKLIEYESQQLTFEVNYIFGAVNET